MKKSKIIIIVLVVLLLLIGGLIGAYFYLLSGSPNNEIINFTIEAGTSKKDIAKNLKTAEVVKSKNATLIYLFFNKDINLQAGTYEINRNMSVKEIIDLISSGKVKMNTVTITFVEGKNVNDFIKLISSKFSYSEEEVKNVLKNKEFMESLVESYDFLTDEVLNGNIIYALEGYLFPDTYEFLEDTSIENIIVTVLNNTKAKLNELGVSKDYHKILTKASIAELEAITYDDRCKVVQVINKRLEMGKGLGMDVTTYYAVNKELGEVLTMNDLSSPSLYNTSELNTFNVGRLPIGPICNPSSEAIKAVLNPSDTNYVYFYANIKTHEVFFANTYDEFLEIQRKVG